MAQVSVEEVFKAIIDAQWGVLSSGDIEAPTGRFTIVEVPKDEGERVEMREAVFEDEVSDTFDNMDAGWYFVIQADSNSLTYDKCKNRDYAFARFALARSAYEEWDDELALSRERNQQSDK